MTDGKLEYLLDVEVEGVQPAVAEIQQIRAGFENSMQAISRDSAEATDNLIDFVKQGAGFEEMRDRLDALAGAQAENSGALRESAEATEAWSASLGRLGALAGAVQAIRAAADQYIEDVQRAVNATQSLSRSNAEMVQDAIQGFKDIGSEEDAIRYIERIREQVGASREEMQEMIAALGGGIEGLSFSGQTEFALLGTSAELDQKITQLNSIRQAVETLQDLIGNAEGLKLDLGTQEFEAKLSGLQEKFSEVIEKGVFDSLSEFPETQLEIITNKLAEVSAARDANQAAGIGLQGDALTDNLAIQIDLQKQVNELTEKRADYLNKIANEQERAADAAARLAEREAREQDRRNREDARGEISRLRDAESALREQIESRFGPRNELDRAGLFVTNAGEAGFDKGSDLQEKQLEALGEIKEAIEALEDKLKTGVWQS